jgi:hypothetical protein
MNNNPSSLYANITLKDVQLASAYYPLLIDIAKHKHCVTYGELVQKAKNAYPDLPVVQNAIAVSTGRRLDVVRIFTTERDLPDLTSLVISKSSGECGAGFTRNFDPKSAREKVYAYDWSSVTTDFDGFVHTAESAIKPRKKRKENEALIQMAEFYTLNKTQLPESIKEQRELIIELLMEGFTPEEAFAQATLLD